MSTGWWWPCFLFNSFGVDISTFQENYGSVNTVVADVPVWDDIFTPTISSPPGENIVTIFSPPLRYFHPLTISNGKSFCSQISLNFVMCIYNKEPFYTFYDFLQIFVNHRLLIQSINISTKTLSFNSKEGIMLKYNHFNPPSFMGWIYGYDVQ